MQLSVPLENQLLPDRFGKYAGPSDIAAGKPKRSFPITIEGAPQGCVSLALTVVDYDAVPVSGFPWIHWCAANIPGDTVLIPEDASRSGVLAMVQGRNSNAGGLVHDPDPVASQGYVGPQPPNATHAYTLTVYALDTKLDLADGFWLNDLRHAIAGHVLGEASLDINSRA